MGRVARVGCLLVLALAGCGGSPERDPGYALMQMNLCLSGLAGCYGKTAYPAVVEEATARIRAGAPGRGDDQRGLPGRRRADRPPDRLPRALLDGPLPRRAAPVRAAGRARALRRRRAHQGADRAHEQPGLQGPGRPRAAAVAVRRDRARRRRLHLAPEHGRGERGGRQRGPVRRAQGDPRPPRGARPSCSAATSTAAARAPRAAPGPAPTTPRARPRAPARLRQPHAPLAEREGAARRAYRSRLPARPRPPRAAG